MPQVLNPAKRKHLTLAGVMVGSEALTGFTFMPGRDFVACAICGDVYQHALSRLPTNQITAETTLAAELHRRAWSRTHAKEHTSTEHRQLALSGRKYSPEATVRLATLGLISLTDLVMDPECAAAALEAPRVPLTDSEG